MANNHILRLHWKLFFPFVGILWLIIGITITYSIRHEEQRQMENLENRLLNVNATVITAYERGANLQSTVNFIKLFTAETTLAPLQLTVYDDNGLIIADNEATTIVIFKENGTIKPEFEALWSHTGNTGVSNMVFDNDKCMINAMTSPDGLIHSFSALPLKNEVLDFLSIDPMVWIVVIVLGISSSALAYFVSKTISRSVYALQDFAAAISSDRLPDNIDSWHFSKDELGNVSRNLLKLYRDKIHAEHEKAYHERQIELNISHELNTPVGIIKGYIDTVVDDKDLPETQKQKFLLRVQQNINRLSNLVGDMNTVMRLHDNRASIKCTPVNFHDMAASLSEDIAQGHITDKMDFIYDIPKGCCVSGHESLLTNAMLNLIYNATQHSGGTKMTLRWIRQENGRHIFEFADNGTGVAEEHVSRLFDLFYRVDSGRAQKNGGPGLGLPLVRRIITALGGNITAANSPAGGLIFTFTLPVA